MESSSRLCGGGGPGQGEPRVVFLVATATQAAFFKQPPPLPPSFLSPPSFTFSPVNITKHNILISELFAQTYHVNKSDPAPQRVWGVYLCEGLQKQLALLFPGQTLSRMSVEETRSHVLTAL